MCVCVWTHTGHSTMQGEKPMCCFRNRVIVVVDHWTILTGFNRIIVIHSATINVYIYTFYFPFLFLLCLAVRQCFVPILLSTEEAVSRPNVPREKKKRKTCASCTRTSGITFWMFFECVVSSSTHSLICHLSLSRIWFTNGPVWWCLECRTVEFHRLKYVTQRCLAPEEINVFSL